MKHFLEWLLPNPTHQSVVLIAVQAPVSARVRLKAATKDEHIDESSFGWFGTGNADSSVFDTGSLKIEKSQKENAVSHKTLELINDSPSNGEHDTGFDPYNSGRFKSRVK